MDKIKTLTLAGLTLLVSNFIVMDASAAADTNAATKEKCYGVVKAGQNDCATKTSSCAGSSNADGQKDAFITLPKGLCDKLVGGNLTSS